MKTNRYLCLAFYLFVSTQFFSKNTKAQNPNWINFTNGDVITDLADNNNILWTATVGGLVKYDKISGNKTFYNKGNSGLPRNEIKSIDSDSSGNIWLATDAGLSMYDGVIWTLYDTTNSGLPTENLLNVAVDLNGIKWIASSEGVTSFDGTNWFTYDTSNSNISNQYIRKIFISPTNEKWIVSLYGIDRFDGTTWTFYDASVIGISVYDIYNIAFKNNEVYVSSGGPFGQGNGLIKFDGITWSAYTIANSGLPYSNVDYVTTDTSGNLWLANRTSFATDYSLVKYDGINWIIFPLPANVFGYFFLSIISIDSANRIFTGTNGAGLSEFNNGNFTKINSSNSGINQNGGDKIFIDDLNEVWVTNYLGFTHFKNQTWEVFDSTNSVFLNSGIADINRDHSGNIWVGSRDGLIKYDGSNWSRYDTSNSGLGDNFINAVIADSANSIWVGTNSAPFRFDGNSWTNFFSNAGSHIIDLFVTDDANIWMGSQGHGLSRFDLNNTWQQYIPSSGGAYNAGAMDKNGTVWYGGSYLHKWNGSSWSMYTTSNGLPWPTVTSLAVDTNNILWVGTQNGLSKFDGVTFTNYFDENSGLTGNYISDIMVDGNNNKWIATSGAVSVFNESGIVLDINDELDNVKMNNVILYPNPFTNKVIIEINNQGPYIDAELIIYDISGREIIKNKLNNKRSEIQRGEISNGIYFYTLRNEMEIIANGKFIAQ